MKRMMVAAMATFIAFSAMSTWADEFPGLAIGQTVRITKATGPEAAGAQDAGPFDSQPNRFRAEVVAMDETTISVSTGGGEPIVVPRTMIGKLEVSRGRSRGRGAAHGLAIGLAIGTIVGLAAGEDEECDPTQQNCDDAKGNSVGKDALLGGLAGATVGALIGIQSWERIEASPQIALLLPPRGVGARLTISW